LLRLGRRPDFALAALTVIVISGVPVWGTTKSVVTRATIVFTALLPNGALVQSSVLSP